MVKIRELEIIKAELEHDIAHQQNHMDELEKKRLNYPLEVDVITYNGFYEWLSDTRKLYKKVTLTLNKQIAEESIIQSLESRIKSLERIIKNT